jgi:hypothetical protein
VELYLLSPGVRFQAGARAPFLYSVQDGSGLHPACYPMGNGGPFPGIKRLGRETGQSPLCSVQVKNGGAIPPLPHTFSWDSANFTSPLLCSFTTGLLSRAWTKLKNVNHPLKWRYVGFWQFTTEKYVRCAIVQVWLPISEAWIHHRIFIMGFVVERVIPDLFFFPTNVHVYSSLPNIVPPVLG